MITTEAAKEVIREHKIIALTAKESRYFVKSLLNPSKPNTALKKAAQQHRLLIKKER